MYLEYKHFIYFIGIFLILHQTNRFSQTSRFKILYLHKRYVWRFGSIYCLNSLAFLICNSMAPKSATTKAKAKAKAAADSSILVSIFKLNVL